MPAFLYINSSSMKRKAEMKKYGLIPRFKHPIHNGLTPGLKLPIQNGLIPRLMLPICESIMSVPKFPHKRELPPASRHLISRRELDEAR
jgi:hypothetical protein